MRIALTSGSTHNTLHARVYTHFDVMRHARAHERHTCAKHGAGNRRPNEPHVRPKIREHVGVHYALLQEEANP